MTMHPQQPLNFNDAPQQRSFDLVPAGTIAPLRMTIRPGGAGPGGWLKRSKNGQSEGLDIELVVLEGPFIKRKFWTLLTLGGETSGHAEAAEISRGTLCAILESARGVRPDDRSETAQKARSVTSYGDFDGLCFVAKIGIAPPDGNYPARNKLIEVITPEKADWRQFEQTPRPAGPASRPAEVPTVNVEPAAQITRPPWAQ